MTESGTKIPEDIEAQFQKVLRDCYDYNLNAIRAYLAALRAFQAKVTSAALERGVDLRRGDKLDPAILAQLFAQHAHSNLVDEARNACGVPDSVPPPGMTTPEDLEAVIEAWEEQLQAVGDDAQLAQVDLQTELQKKQQSLQLTSNVSKMLHDTAMAVIRNMAG